MRKVKYKVTGMFGDSYDGDITTAYVLSEDSSREDALLYHPRISRDLCASIEMAHLDGEYYVSSGKIDMLGYINIESQKQLNELVRNIQGISYRKTK